MSTVIAPNGKPKAVKNLGWILNHWKEVDYLGFNFSPQGMNDGEFIAKLRDGSVYLSQYASLSVFWNWVKRPVFIGVKLKVRVNFNGPLRVFTVGNDEFNRINRLPYDEQLDAILRTGICDHE